MVYVPITAQQVPSSTAPAALNVLGIVILVDHQQLTAEVARMAY